MHKIPPRSAGLLARALAALLLAAAASGAAATDLVSAPLPANLPDLTAQVGLRRLHLPPGHWVLVARESEQTVGKHDRTGVGLDAWLAQEDAGEFRALVHLFLPVDDFPRVHRLHGHRCSEEDGIQRVDLTRNPTLPECLGVYGHRDLLEAMASRSPAVAAWMSQARVGNPGAVVRFTYRQRSDGGYGGISLFLPTAHFESDEVAGAWASQLRSACQPLFEGRSHDASLPQPPAVAATDAAPAN